MKYIKLFEFFHTDVLTHQKGIAYGKYRKFVPVTKLNKAYKFLGSKINHTYNTTGNSPVLFKDDFQLLLEELFLEKKIDMYCTSSNCRKRVQFVVKNIWYTHNSVNTGRPQIIFQTSQHTSHFLDFETDSHLIFIYSKEPFKEGPYEQDLGILRDAEKYNI